MRTIAIVGASEDPDRYSNMACRVLRDLGHKVYAVSLHGRGVHGAVGVARLSMIHEPVDVVSMYVNPSHQAELVPQILGMSPLPKRVIFNPGSESMVTEHALQAAGVATMHACTIVMAKTGQFDPARM